jgi:hypothetical protein
MFSRNLRHIVPFVFCPIEPPRPSSQNNQIFVRKKHTLASLPRNQDQGLLGLFRRQPTTGNAGTISLEARVPNPPILVPTEPIPLTFILKRDVGSQGIVYVRTIQVMLGITTFITAQGFRRELGYLKPILNLGDLNIALGAQENEIVIKPADLLQQGASSKGLSLPDTIPPSFRTCNIARKYTLVLQMGICSSLSLPPETIQLTADIQVYSGFKPPPELLERATRPEGPAPGQFTTLSAQDGTSSERPGPSDLPTYNEAIGETQGTSMVVDENRRGRFEVDEKHLQGAETWDADEKR